MGFREAIKPYVGYVVCLTLGFASGGGLFYVRGVSDARPRKAYVLEDRNNNNEISLLVKSRCGFTEMGSEVGDPNVFSRDSSRGLLDDL